MSVPASDHINNGASSDAMGFCRMLAQRNPGAVRFSSQRTLRQNACIAMEKSFLQIGFTFTQTVRRSTPTPLGALGCEDYCQMKKRNRH